MDAFWSDLKHAARIFVGRPGFTVLALIPLGLGIGLTTAIFSAVHSVLVQSLPYHEPDRLVRVWERRPRMGAEADRMAAFSMDHFRAWRDANDVFESLAVYQDQSFNLTGGSQPERIDGQRVSPGLLSMLGVEPLYGRTFAESEAIPGNEHVVVISHSLWRRLFGSDPGIVGRSVALDGEPYTVIGILPPDFRFPDARTDFWTPMVDTPPEPARPGEMRVELVPVIGKLARGVSVERAEAAAQAFLDHYRQTSAMTQRMDEGVTIRLSSFHEQLVKPLRPALLVLMASAVLVLLIACANVSNLFLVRAQNRQAEHAVRQALGASRSRLVRERLTESLLYGVAGGAIGIVVAYWSVRGIALLEPGHALLRDGLSIHSTVLGFNLAVALLTALIVGLVPALRSSRVDLVRGLTGKHALSGGSGRLRGAFAATEIALALVLFVAAGLMLRSFMTLVRTDPGYEPANVLTFRLNLPQTSYPSVSSRRVLYDRLRESLAGIPGVVATSVVSSLPLEGERMITMLHIEGRPMPTDRMDMPRASVRIVSPDFFRSMGIRVLRGREFAERDGEGAPTALAINQSLAERYFESEDPVGRRVSRMGEILGVVADVRQEGLDQPPEPELYLDYQQLDDRFSEALQSMSVVVRYDPRHGAFLPDALRARLSELDAELPLSDLRPMEDRLLDSVARPRLYAVLLGLFAMTAFVLAVSGVYSVMSFSVAERTHETGVRVALGATSSDVVRLVLREATLILGVGLAAGLALSALLSRSLESLLFQVAPFDPWTVGLVGILLATTVLVASALPARRAASADAMKALRYE